jgi:hypothetical protein
MSILQRSKAVHGLEINVTSRCKKQLRDGSMSAMGCHVKGSGPIFPLMINVAASFNELPHDSSMTICCRSVVGNTLPRASFKPYRGHVNPNVESND